MCYTTRDNCLISSSLYQSGLKLLNMMLISFQKVLGRPYIIVLHGDGLFIYVFLVKSNTSLDWAIIGQVSLLS